MAKVLILFAHPLIEKSRVHVELLGNATKVEGITINDLYQNYPDFDIDVEKEQDLLLAHDIIIWQHPLYWYSAPAMLKQWLDLVLEHGWAYGEKGSALKGKKIFNALTSGGSQEGYQRGNFNKYSIHDFLAPFERTAILCKMDYWPPWWVHGVHKLNVNQIGKYGLQYKELLESLRDDRVDYEEILRVPVLNDLFPVSSMT